MKISRSTEFVALCVPLGFLLLFLLYPLVDLFSAISLFNPPQSLLDIKILEALVNSLSISVAVTLLCLVMAFPAAWLITFKAFRGRAIIEILLFVPLILPPFVASIGIRKLLARFGPLNLALLDLGVIEQPIDYLGGTRLFGVVITEALHLYPLLYIAIRSGLTQIDSNVIAAARMLGANSLQVFARIIMPLLLAPVTASALIVAVWSFTDLGTPLIFEYRDVLPVHLFFSLDDIHADPRAFWFTLLILAVSIALFCASAWIKKRGGVYQVGERTAAGYTLQKMRPFSRAAAYLYFAVLLGSAALPHTMVVITSLTEFWGFSVVPERMSLIGFSELASHPLALVSIKNSILFSSMSTVLDCILALLIAFAVVRGRSLLRHVVLFLALAPLAIPGLALAFSYYSAFQGTFLDPRNDPTLLLISGYALRRLPLLVRMLTVAFEQTGDRILEAAAVLGANSRKTFTRIQLPLLIPVLSAGAISCFIFSVLEVSESLVLATQEKFYPITKALYVLLARPEGPVIACALGVLSMGFLLLSVLLVRRLTGKNLLELGEVTNRTKSHFATLALIIPLIATAELSATSKQIVLLSPHWEGVRYETEQGFKRYLARVAPETSVEFIWKDVGGTSDIIRFIVSEFDRSPHGIGVDLMFGGGQDSFAYLKTKGYFSKLAIPERTLKELGTGPTGKVYDAELYWIAPQLTGMGILCNNGVLRKLELPIPFTWGDLTKETFRGWLTSSDPRKSGSIHFFYETILQSQGWQAGWELLLRLARNHRAVLASQSQASLDVMAGEAACTFSLDSQAWPQKRRLGKENVHFVIPENEGAINADAIALLKGSPNKDIAETFVNYLLSEEAQRLFYLKKGSKNGPRKYDISRMPVLSRLYEEPAATYVEINPFSWRSTFVYNGELGATRWEVMNDLLHIFFVEHSQLLAGAPDAVLEAIEKIVPSEALVLQYASSGNWAQNIERDAILQKWRRELRIATDYQSQVFSQILVLVLTISVVLIGATLLRRK